MVTIVWSGLMVLSNGRVVRWLYLRYPSRHVIGGAAYQIGYFEIKINNQSGFLQGQISGRI